MNNFWLLFSLICAAPPVAWLLYRYQPWVRRPFINKTGGLINDQQMLQLWQSAALDLATNPFSVLMKLHAPDPNALRLRPRAITVQVHEDTAIDGDGWVVKTGYVLPLAVRGLTRCNRVQPIVITISRRWATQVLPYEFQNAMLAMLGYDVRGR